MKIPAISFSGKQYVSTNKADAKNVSISNNNFNFSSEASNALKINTLASVSFGNSEQKAKIEALNVYSKLQQVYNTHGEKVLDDAKELYKMASKDIYYLDADERIDRKMDVVDDRLTVVGFVKNDSLNRPLYEVDLKDGRISKITTFNIYGIAEEEKEFDIKTGELVSCDFIKEDKKACRMEFSSQKPSVYYEGIRKTGKYNCYDKVMYFIDEDKMTYQEDVKKARAIYSTSPLRIGKEIEFTNSGNYTYMTSYDQGFADRPTTADEVIKVEDFSIVTHKKNVSL